MICVPERIKFNNINIYLPGKAGPCPEWRQGMQRRYNAERSFREREEAPGGASSGRPEGSRPGAEAGRQTEKREARGGKLWQRRAEKSEA